MKISKKTLRNRQLQKKLDTILNALGYQVTECCYCTDGIRQCGLRNNPEYVECVHCEASGINIGKIDKGGWDGD